VFFRHTGREEKGERLICPDLKMGRKVGFFYGRGGGVGGGGTKGTIVEGKIGGRIALLGKNSDSRHFLWHSERYPGRTASISHYLKRKTVNILLAEEPNRRKSRRPPSGKKK